MARKANKVPLDQWAHRDRMESVAREDLLVKGVELVFLGHRACVVRLAHQDLLVQRDLLERKVLKGMLDLQGLWVYLAVVVTSASQEPKDPMVSKALLVLKVHQVVPETRVCRDQQDLLVLTGSPGKRESLECQVQRV